MFTAAKSDRCCGGTTEANQGVESREYRENRHGQRDRRDRDRISEFSQEVNIGHVVQNLHKHDQNDG